MLTFLQGKKPSLTSHTEPEVLQSPSSKLNGWCFAYQFRDWEALVPQPATTCFLEEVGRRRESDTGEAEEGVSMACPLQLKLTGSQRGGLDLRLQLLHVSWGDALQLSPKDRTAHDYDREVWWGWLQSRRLEVVNKAAALSVLRLLMPNSMPHLVKYMAALGGLSACCRLADRVQEWFRGLEEDSTQLECTAADGKKLRGGIVQDCVGDTGSETSQGSSDVMNGDSPLVDLVSDWVEAAGAAALSLWLLSVVWSTCHPESFHIVECLGALIPVAAGYAHTAKQAARGAIPSGRALEDAWRQRHKWAAQKVAHLMTHSYTRPPLGPLAGLMEGMSVRVGLMVEGRGLDAGSSSWGAPLGLLEGDSVSLDLSWSVGGSRHDQSSPPPETTSADDVAVEFEDLSASSRAWLNECRASQRVLHLDDIPLTAKQDQEHFEQWHAAIGCCDVHPHEHAATSSRGQGEPSSSVENSSLVDDPASTSAVVSPFNTQPVASSAVPAVIPSEQVWLSLLGSDADGDSIEKVAPLFGQSDHAAAAVPLTLLQQVELIGRAGFLLLVFIPFLLFGPLLLMASVALDTQLEGPQAAGAYTIRGRGAANPELASVLRRWAFRLLLLGCRGSGAAFIKWGQWAATREDIFPRDFCSIMSALHDKAPTHRYAYSRREVERVLGRKLVDTFAVFDKKPVASGSIAQVHRARVIGAPQNEWLAVKVRHPNVARQIWMDFQIMQVFANALERYTSLKGLGVKESVSQFSHTMTAQADLRVEAAHLERFYRNFAPVRSSVTQPRPLRATESVLIESFEPGSSVADYMGRYTAYNTAIVALGVDTYLKMLLQDNFVHTDLHPGNIMVRIHEGRDGLPPRVQLVLLDFGLAEELTPVVRYHFISFLNMIAKGDAVAATEHLLCWSSNQNCPDPTAFTADMVRLFAERCNIYSEEGIDLDLVLKSILRLARKHQISVDSNYASLVLGVCVLVGFATSLDPRVNLMDAAAPCLFVHNLTGRVLGRLYG